MKVLLTLLILSPFFLLSQDRWTLQTCIDSALVNNPRLKLAEIDLSIADINVRSSQWNFLPSVNGNASHGYNWGQTIDPFTNTFATNQVRYNNFYLSSSLTLFSGLQNHYERKIEGIDQAIILANKEIEKRNVTLEILGAYLQAKLNEEVFVLKSKHLSYTQEQVKRAQLLESLEYETKQKRMEIVAQESKDAYELVLVQNDLKKSLFLLQMLIGIEPDSTFSLADSVSLVFTSYADEININSLQIEKNLLESKRNKGALSPSVRINASLGSGYSENNQTLSPDGNYVPKPFNDQLSENFYQSLSATLTVPIFNGVKSYSQIAIYQEEYKRVQIENDQRINQLANSKLQNELELNNQKEALISAQSSYESYKLLFEGATIQYDNGAIDFYQYLQVKDAFFNAESELIQAGYRLIFAKIILSVYD